MSQDLKTVREPARYRGEALPRQRGEQVQREGTGYDEETVGTE